MTEQTTPIFDFDGAWGIPEVHQHCMLTEDLCRKVSHELHGHPAICCTCEATGDGAIPRWQQFGYVSIEQWNEGEDLRRRNRRSNAHHRREEAIRLSWDTLEGFENRLAEEIISPAMPIAQEDFPANGKMIDTGTRSPSKQFYENRATEAPRVVSTSFPLQHGRLVLAHTYHGDQEGSCNRCHLPRENRIHQLNESTEDPVISALKVLVDHQCTEESGCLAYQCWFDYRGAITKIRRILKEI